MDGVLRGNVMKRREDGRKIIFLEINFARSLAHKGPARHHSNNRCSTGH